MRQGDERAASIVQHDARKHPARHRQGGVPAGVMNRARDGSRPQRMCTCRPHGGPRRPTVSRPGQGSFGKPQRFERLGASPHRKESSTRRGSTRRNGGSGTPHESSDTSARQCPIIVMLITGMSCRPAADLASFAEQIRVPSAARELRFGSIRHVGTGYLRPAAATRARASRHFPGNHRHAYQRQPRALAGVRVQRFLPLADAVCTRAPSCATTRRPSD